MSWRFPRRLPRGGEVVDVDDVNLALLPYAEEAGGELNEHNIAEDGFTDRADVADDVYAALWQLVVEDDGSLAATTVAVTGLIEHTGSFGSIIDANEDAFSKTVVSREGTLSIYASFQTEQAWPGVLYGLFVDGTLIEESVWGSTEFAAEQIKIAGATVGEASPGIGYPARAVLLEANVPVAKGTHVVEVRAMALIDDYASGTVQYYVFARELIILELVR